MNLERHCKFKELLPQLEAYIRIMKAANTVRNDAKMYIEIEKRRVTLHDEILNIAGTTRKDEEFSMALATFCESMLNL